jgi:hypothetical protein
MDALHLDDFLTDYERGFGRLREPCANVQVMRAEYSKRIMVTAFNNRLKLRSKHYV